MILAAFSKIQDVALVRLDVIQVASYEFTTLTCVPGVIKYRGSKIQVNILLVVSHPLEYATALLLHKLAVCVYHLVFKDGQSRCKKLIRHGMEVWVRRSGLPPCNPILHVFEFGFVSAAIGSSWNY